MMSYDLTKDGVYPRVRDRVGDVIGVVCNAHATNSTARGALGEGVAATEDRRQRTEGREQII